MTVCRRGGMSVTQAGRGGMEWLAGGRVPDWATPYSAQATAYLQQHYSAYWSEIMAYGFDPAHQALIPYINEDPDLVCSLMDVGKVRYGYSNGNCGFGAVYIPTRNTTTWTKAKPRATSYWAGVFGGWAQLGWASQSDTALVFGYNGGYNTGNMSYNGKAVVFEIRKDGAYIGGTRRYSYSSYPSNMPASFSLNAANGSETYESKCFEDGIISQDLVPCRHGGVTGMLDIVPSEPKFYPNIGAGTFELIDSPS